MSSMTFTYVSPTFADMSALSVTMSSTVTDVSSLSVTVSPSRVFVDSFSTRPTISNYTRNAEHEIYQ